MTRNEFIFAENFPTLTDAQIHAAFEEVTTLFFGVKDLWHVLPLEVAERKRTLCYNYLLAWRLLDLNPTAASGVIGNGGMAVSSKSIGGTSLSFQDMEVQEGIKQLNSNVFGQKALVMIQGAPERFGIYA